ncbi:DUF6174 domain-containing protein [Cellulomonas sp. McL0617]|uniref:DUF6174 domain-containing protein n=1 Tax=Cellulomonas sp. McL0617 TaxID=3415675 RepID=UPI003CEA5104
MRRVVAALLLVLPLAGCAASPASGPRPSAGQGTATAASYTYVLESSCGERALLGRYAVTVKDARVTEVEDLATHAPAADYVAAYVPTIDALTDRAASEHPSELAYDPGTGMLTAVRFEGDPNAIDDEECYVVSAYSPT